MTSKIIHSEKYSKTSTNGNLELIGCIVTENIVWVEEEHTYKRLSYLPRGIDKTDQGNFLEI